MAENAEAVVQEKPKGSKLKLILIIVIGLAAAGDLTFRAISYFKGSKTATAAGSAEKSGAGTDHDSSPEGKKHESKATAVKSTMNLDAFLVNLADKEDVRFVKATFILGLEEAQLGEELAKDPIALAITRDTIVAILSSKISDDILTSSGKDKLREEIRTGVNAVLPKGKVQNVFIVDFVVQL